MKINKSQLVELLTEKTGLEKGEVEQQLKELIKRIKDAAGRGKALEIKNFGMFYFDSDKNLRFDPADSFRTEVNFKYAGMEPVEVKPPRDTSSPADEPGKTKEEKPDEEDVFGLEESTPAKKEKKEEKKGKKEEEEGKLSPVFELDDGSPSEKPEVDDDPFKDLLGDDKIKPAKEKEIKKAGTTPAISVSTQSDKKKQPEKTPPKKSQPSKKKKKDPVMLVMAVVLAFVIVVAGFFIINDMMDSPPPQQPASPDAAGLTEQQEIIEPAPEPEPADVVEPDTEPEPAVQEPEPVTETVYGLTGSIVDEANDGFTIVLHSLRNNNNAQAAAENLREQGYRTIVIERTVDDASVFRVAIGQFPTVREAQEKAAELPEPYRNQNFIQRIQ